MLHFGKMCPRRNFQHYRSVEDRLSNYADTRVVASHSQDQHSEGAPDVESSDFDYFNKLLCHCLYQLQSEISCIHAAACSNAM
jgi:hypothetical protein